MPSGAKRRKAAKKKKKEQPDANGAEAVSFTGEENDETEVSAPASPGQIDVKVEEGSVEIVKGMGSEDDYEIRNLGVEGGKSGKDSSDGSSSSSSSDDEKVEFQKSEAVVDSADMEKKVDVEKTEVVLDSAVEQEVKNALDSANYAVESALVCEEVVHVTEAVVDEPAQLVKEKVVDVTEAVVDEPAKVVEEKDVYATEAVVDEPAKVVEEEVAYVNEVVVDEPTNVVEKEVAYITESAEVEPALVVEEVNSRTETAGVELEQVVKEVVYVTEAPVVELCKEDPNIPEQPELDFDLKRSKDDGLTLTSESHGESSSVEPSELKNGEDKAFPSSDSRIVKNGNGLGHVKDPEIQDSVNDQLPLSSVPLAVQRTSWKGCCGLFEVFTGSR